MNKINIPKQIQNLPVYEPIKDKFDIRVDANECYDNIMSCKDNNSSVIDIINNLKFNRYPDPYCTNLRNSIAEKFNADPENIVCSNGSDELISLLEVVFTKENGKILCFAPDFSMYKFYCNLYGGEYVEMYKNDDMEINIDDVIDKANADSDIKMIIFSNPCNPTGGVIRREKIEKLISGVNCLVTVDEAYMDFADESVIDLIYKNKNLAVLKTFSKAYAMAGIRLGYIIACKELCNALNAVKSPYNVNSLSAAIGEAMLRKSEYSSKYTNYVKNNLGIFKKQIEEVFINNKTEYTSYKSNTNFVFIKTKKADIIFQMLLDRNICVRCFDGEFLRITIDSEQNNVMIINALDSVLNKIKEHD